jgi:molybdopterin synthase sulfur carrier subunit
MKIKVLTFGILTDYYPSEFEVDVKNLKDLLYQMAEKFPLLTEMELRVAVNNVVVNVDHEINFNDVVAIMPPYSGG